MSDMAHISINGSTTGTGRLVETAGDWHGKVEGSYPPGLRVSVVAISEDGARFGEALITSCEVYAGSGPLSEFQDDGPLYRWTPPKREG